MSSVDLALLAVLNVAVFVSAVLVITMQPGFMLLEAGSVSRKNAVNNLFKNLIDFAAGGLVFWAVGFMTFNGEGPVVAWLAEMGWTKTPPASDELLQPADSLYFLFQLGFASAAVTISSGAVTGRISPYAYLLFAVIFTGLIYPVIGFAVWHPAGPLYGEFNDFAGGVVVHSVGAAAGLAGAVMLRPRLGFKGYDPVGLGDERLFRIAASHAPHNTPIAALGVMLLWIGWFSFNGGTLFAGGLPAGSGSETLPATMELFGAVLVNTALAPCSAVVVTLLIQAALRIDLNMQDLLNSVVAGLVAVTAAANEISPLGAIVAGAGGALIYRFTRIALSLMFVDDPVGAVAAHGLTGVLGAMCFAFSTPDAWVDVALRQGGYGMAIFLAVFIASAIALAISDLACRFGALLLGRASFRQVFSQNFLRVHHSTEIEGLDERLHGQDAYNFRSIT